MPVRMFLPSTSSSRAGIGPARQDLQLRRGAKHISLFAVPRGPTRPDRADRRQRVVECRGPRCDLMISGPSQIEKRWERRVTEIEIDEDNPLSSPRKQDR